MFIPSLVKIITYDEFKEVKEGFDDSFVDEDVDVLKKMKKESSK